jgi:steroid 5-alpha reductase family enzyme
VHSTNFYSLIFVVPVLGILYYRQLKHQNATSLDMAWTLLVGLAPLFHFLSAPSLHKAVAALLMILWSLRLALHLLPRLRTEDPRYRKLREKLSAKAFWRVYLLQGLLIYLLSLSLEYTLISASHASRIFALIAFIWGIFCIAGEGLADKQLRNFKERGGSGLCQEGLWAYSRHPNYFFEWLFWLWLPLMCLGHFHPLSLLPALLMYLFLRYFTGVSVTEAYMSEKYGEAFRDYQAKVPPFFPRIF